MRKLFASLILILFSGLTAMAQLGTITTYDVVETPKWLDKDYRNAYVIALDADQKVALDSWSSILKSRGATTYFYNPDQLIFVSENADLPEISPQKLKVYARFQYDGTYDATLLTLWFQQPDGQFITSDTNPDTDQAIYKFMLGFRFQSLADLKDHIYREQLEIAKNRFPDAADAPVTPAHPLKGSDE